MSAGRPSLSICIPTYNRAQLLERVLRHLAAGPDVLDGVPILVADNGSPDDTIAMLERVAVEFPRLGLDWHRHPENLGAVASTAWLLAHAPDTDYVWCLADDDFPTRGAISFVRSLLRELDRPRWLHLPHLWEADGRVHLESPRPESVEVFPTSRELFLAYTHWLTFISAAVVERDALAQAVEELPTCNEWAPLIWYVNAGRDGHCAVADRVLVRGTAGTSWEDKKALVLADRVIEAYDEGLCRVVTEEEYARTLDGRYAGGQFFECWAARPLETLVAAVERFPWSAQLRAFLWTLARRHARPDAVAALAAACRRAGLDVRARDLVDEGERRFAEGDAQAAVELFAAAIRELPTHATAWNDLGVALHALRRPDAREAFDLALELAPDDPDALLNRALFFLDERRTDEAARDARRLLELRPNDADAAGILQAAAG
jgi:glycosyltransferase involved in cell wall biosynthesis